MTAARSDRYNRLRAERNARRRGQLMDRRRAVVGTVSDGEIKRLAPGGMTRTVHPATVRDPRPGETVLKTGANSVKLGGDVLVGRLQGAKIVSLTLEERATCPVSCPLWRACYGNNMEKTHRYAHGPELVARIAMEVADLCAAHDQVLVRLHILGDFWCVDYVRFWAVLLALHPGLHVFGFTAHLPDTEIGAEVARWRGALPGRFMIRHSGTCGTWGAFSINAMVGEKTVGTGPGAAIVCPEQLDANEGSPARKHCGNCGACWSTDRPIAFIAH